LLLLAVLNSLDNGKLQAQLTVTGSYTPAVIHGYCDIIMVTIGIRNIGGSTVAVTGRIEFDSYDFDLADISGLPSGTVDDTNPFANYIFFAAGNIAPNTWVYYDYQVILKAPSPDTYEVKHRAYPTGDPSSWHQTEVDFTNVIPHKPVPGTQLLSEHLELDPTSLFPVEPASGSNVYACNPALSQSIYIEEELLIDLPEYCLYNGASTGGVFMGNGGRITVQAGATLYIDNMVLTSCDQMWRGIYVESGGILSITNSIIEHAQYGIEAERGATVNVRGTVFLNNYVGFYVSPDIYRSPDPVEPQLSYVKSDVFYDNLFICTDGLRPNYAGQSPAAEGRSYAGIEVHNLHHWRVPGWVIGSNEGHANYFEGLVNGVLATNTTLFVGDAFFKDIQPDLGSPYSIQGYGIRHQQGHHLEVSGNTFGTFQGADAHFDNVRHGIWSSGASVSVTGMTMADVGTGIEIRRTRNRVIGLHDNAIYAEDRAQPLHSDQRPYQP
jgi:hypothetical protein